MSPDTAYQKLLEISYKIGWPITYYTDITVHDKQALLDYEWQYFIWAVRQTGTELYLIHNNSVYMGRKVDGGPWIMQSGHWIFHHISKHRYFWCYENQIKEITPDEGREVVSHDPEKIVKLWLKIKDRPQLLPSVADKILERSEKFADKLETENTKPQP